MGNSKTKLRSEIDAQIQAYYDKGGKVTHIPAEVDPVYKPADLTQGRGVNSSKGVTETPPGASTPCNEYDLTF